MGYNLYITRQENWFDESDEKKISLNEWKEIIKIDSEMRLDNFAETSVDNQSLIYENSGLAVWTKYSLAGQDENEAWFDFSKGNIVVKNPDKEIINKMIELSKRLNARVQGDEGEYYDKNFMTKKWWQIWK